MPGLFTTVLLISCACYFVLGMAGAFSKDIYDTLVGKCKKIQIQKIILGGILAAVLMPFLETLLLAKIGAEALLALGFLIGVLSFELFGKISSISGIKNIAKDAVEIKNILKENKEKQEQLNEKYCNELESENVGEIMPLDEDQRGV